MAHNAAFYQQQPSSQVPMYSNQHPQQQPPISSQHAQQPPAGPPQNIYQQMGLQQPQPGQARPRAYQDPQYQQSTTISVHDYWQQQQRQQTPQPVYTQPVQSAQSYIQPQVQPPPSPLPQHIPLQHAPSAHTVTGYQAQYQPSQPSYTPSPYQSSMTPQPQHPVHPTHAYTQSVPNAPYAAPVTPQYINPVTNPPPSHTPIPPIASAPNIPLAHQAMSSSRQPTTGSRPLPPLENRRSDSLPLSGNPSVAEPAPAAASSRTPYSTTQSNTRSAPQRQSGFFVSDTAPDRGPPARVMARMRSDTAPIFSDIHPASSSQLSRSSSSRPTSSFSAGITQSAGDIPTPGAVSSGVSTRRPLPSPSGGVSRMAKHQSIDISRFPGSAGSAINATDSILSSRSASPPNLMRDRNGDASTGSRSASMSPTKLSESPIRRGPPGAAPTPFTQLPKDDASNLTKRRASPPRWVGSARSRSNSPTKPSPTAAAFSKYSSPPGPSRPSSSYAGSTSGSTSTNSSFMAARSVFARNSDTASRPTPPLSNASTRSGPSSTPPQPASPPKPKPPPVWKRTIPDRGDASKIDFIGKSTFNPTVFIDPPFPGSAAYARNLALANAGGIPGYAGPPPAGYRASVAGPPVGYGQYGPPPAGYGAYPPPPHSVPRQQSSPQRYPNSHETETEEDSEEETEGDGSDVSGSEESSQGQRSKGKGASNGATKNKSKAKDKVKNGRGDRANAKSKDKSSARSDKGSDRTVKSKAKGSVKGSGSTKPNSRHRRGELSEEDEEDSIASASARGPSDSEIGDDDNSGTEEVDVPVLKKGQARKIALRELEKENQREVEKEIEREKERERERQRREHEEWERERERREREEWERTREREQEEWEREKEKREREEWEREKERERREREEWEREKEREKQKEREEWERQRLREREEWEREKLREIERERERLEKEKERELREKERQITQEREKLEREREKERELAKEWEREQELERRQRDRSGSNPQLGNRDPPSRIPVRTHTSTFSMPINGNPGSRPPPMVRDTGYRGENDFGHNRRNGNNRQRLYGLDLNLDDEPPPSLRRSPSPSSTAPSAASTGYGSEIRPRANISRQQEPEKPSWTPRQKSFQKVQPQQASWAQRQAPQQRQPQPSSEGGRQSPVRFSSKKNQTQSLPSINIIESPSPIGGREKLADMPKIAFEGAVIDDEDGTPSAGPSINVQNFDEGPSARGRNAGLPPSNIPKVQVFEVGGTAFSGPDNSDGPIIAVSGPDDDDNHNRQPPPQNRNQRQPLQRQPLHQAPPVRRGTGTGLICGGCGGPIIGRIVSAMNLRWHPDCFRCAVCNELLEHVSSYEHNGRPYCHLDYHENFAPQCYHCKTAIIEERFISLDDPGLGKRNYHEQHFFCAECGDPFLPPSSGGISKGGEITLSGDGQFESDDVAFTVYKGHPYCENCHVRLRMPKCKRCKRSIRDGDEAVEALGGKWCWSCFVCASCHNPFEDPAFFERGGQPYCEPCFSIILRNEI